MNTARRIHAAVLAGVLALVGEAGAAAPRAEAPAVSDESAVPRVYLAPLVVEGPLAKAVQAELAQRLAEAIAKPGLEIVALEADATHVVHAVVKVVDRDFAIALELRERERDTVVADVDERCELCGRTEVAETMTSMGLALRRRVDVGLRPPPVVSVQSEPPGALVLLDGKPFGTTPVELPVAAGKHELRITKAGYIAQTRSLELVSGVRESLTVGLQTIPPPSRPRRPIREALGWTALGTGAAGLVAGATLLALHGRPIARKCTGSAVDADGTCRYMHATLVPGAVVGAIGVGLLATGIALVVIERRRAPKASTHARLGLGPGGPLVRF